MGAKNNDKPSQKQAIVKFYTMEYQKCGNFNSKNDSRPCMGASAILKSVDFRAFEINVKTIAPTQKLYQFGHAIWWGQTPRIISTFLESYDFSGKTIVPVCTSHSSGIGSSATNLHALTDGSVTWLEGRRFSSTSTKEEVAQWLKDSGIQKLLVQNKEEPMERVFDFETKTVMLNSGYPMPLNGIGTYSLTGDTCVISVSEALKRGVRLIDTAYMYHNEEEVGRAVRESGIPREDIFVITKLYPNQFAEPEKAINDAIEKLNLGYIDGRDIIGTNQRKPSKVKGSQMI